MVQLPRLGIVTVSVREGRVGQSVADWFVERARAHGGFEVEPNDLKAVNLPVLSEPNHPRLKKYTQDTTKAWSATVDALDAFVFVTPEYNFATPPSLVNALDHLYNEWLYKPAGFVSYGGISGGLRATQMTRMMLATFKVVPMVEQVIIPFVAREVKDGVFPGGEKFDTSAQQMLDELLRWTNALRGLR
jgi:NAD(P)H-dependent FMN reductase